MSNDHENMEAETEAGTMKQPMDACVVAADAG